MATREKSPSAYSLAWWNNELPIEILLEEILPRLPVKSLLRFKCVCKFFRTLITSPEFIHRHLHCSLSSDADRQLIHIGKAGVVYSFHLDSREFPTVTLPFPDDGLYLVGSCNGLVCIFTHGLSSFIRYGALYYLIIFNRSTGVFREIDFSNLYFSYSYGFGFDDITNDYKVVRVGSHTDTAFNFTSYETEREVTEREVEVYSLKSGAWSLVERTHNRDSMNLAEHGVLIDKHLVHWKFQFGHLYSEFRIGCFDLRKNRWGDDVPLPDGCKKIGSNGRDMYFASLFKSKLVHLGVLDGCLCLLTDKCINGFNDFWVMKEYGVKDSWIKLVSINSLIHNLPRVKSSPFAYARESQSEILVRKDEQSKFFWYNIRDKTWRWAEIHGVPVYTEACVCKGSLVSIPGGRQFQSDRPRVEDRNGCYYNDCLRYLELILEM